MIQSFHKQAVAWLKARRGAIAARLPSLRPPSGGRASFRRPRLPERWPALPPWLALPRWSLPGGLRPWITLVSFGFVLAALISHGRQLLQLSLDLQGWYWLLLGVGVTLLSLMANGAAFAVVLAHLGQRPRWQGVIALYMTTNLRKYLPGGIWHLSSRVLGLRSEGAPLQAPIAASVALLAVLLDPLLAAVAALALVPLGGWQGGLALLTPLPLLLLLPRWLNPLLLRLERRRSRDLALAEAEPPTPALGGYPWLPLLAELLFVLLRFAGFACCVAAFDLQLSLDWWTWLAGFLLAWTAGLVVPGAPGGLGVFEAVLLLRLGVALPEAPLLAVALSYRLISTLADLLGAALVVVDQRLFQGRQPDTSSQ
jgi:uncharacterized membrane protein YbhN (UPF0104 family)